MFANLKIGKKLGVGFAIVLLLFVVASYFNYSAFLSVEEHLHAIGGCEADKSLMIEKEVDHLQWANRLCQLFYDEDVNHVDVQLDDHKCGLGQWLYSAETQSQAAADPALAALLADIKKPHSHLHESASEIDEVYDAADPAAVQKAVAIFETETSVALNETQGILGKLEEHFADHAGKQMVDVKDDIDSTVNWMVILVTISLVIGLAAA